VVATWETLPTDNVLAWHLVPAPATGAADVAAAQAVGDAVATHWNALATAAMHTSYAASEVQTYPLHTPSHPAVLSTTTAAGGQPGDPSAAPLAVLVKHEIVRRGRGSQGRTFLQPFPQSGIDADGRTISASFADSITAAWSDFVSAVSTDVATATGSACFFGQISKIPPGAFYAANDSVTERLISTQRRRTRRRS
jgi:hypothetical protein